jgi:hypothetical protein
MLLYKVPIQVTAVEDGIFELVFNEVPRDFSRAEPVEAAGKFAFKSPIVLLLT